MTRYSKTYSFQVKDLGVRTDDAGNEFGQIEAYGSIFGNVDEGNDRVNKGAFKRTIINSKSRALARNNKYIAAMLWQHDTHELIGGWYDLAEDNIGLLGKGEIALATQRGREYYALAKAGMATEFSIIYDIPAGGAKYDKSGVRDLIELRLFSIDPVTFGMNDETFLVDVKGNKPVNRSQRTRRAKQAAPVQRQQKTFQDHLADEQCQDLLEDFQDVLVSALADAVYDAFQVGDTPESDVKDALDAFSAAVMEWVADAQRYGLADYLDDHTDEYSSAENLLQYGSDSRPNYGYSYMARRTPLHRKAMDASDATTGGFQAKVTAMKAATKAAMKSVKDHAALLHKSADAISELVGGTEGTKAGRTFSAANTQALQDHADSLHDAADDVTASVRKQTKAINSAADDLATVLQGSEAAYGTDPGDAGTAQEGKAQGTSPHKARSAPAPDDSTLDDDTAAAILSIFQPRKSA